jgi:hypothetical protein
MTDDAIIKAIRDKMESVTTDEEWEQKLLPYKDALKAASTKGLTFTFLFKTIRDHGLKPSQRVFRIFFSKHIAPLKKKKKRTTNRGKSSFSNTTPAKSRSLQSEQATGSERGRRTRSPNEFRIASKDL